MKKYLFPCFSIAFCILSIVLSFLIPNIVQVIDGFIVFYLSTLFLGILFGLILVAFIQFSKNYSLSQTFLDTALKNSLLSGIPFFIIWAFVIYFANTCGIICSGHPNIMGNIILVFMPILALILFWLPAVFILKILYLKKKKR